MLGLIPFVSDFKRKIALVSMVLTLYEKELRTYNIEVEVVTSWLEGA